MGYGAIAPGWIADIVLMEDMQNVRVRDVITGGKIRVKKGVLLEEIPEPVPPLLENTMRLPSNLSVESFIPRTKQAGQFKVNALNIAKLMDTQTEVLDLPAEDGRVQFPLPDGVCLASVIGRHGQNRPSSLAFVTGFPLRQGAIASTVSHDSHNLILIGKTPQDLLAATQTLSQCGGGLAAVSDGNVLATVPLPIAGLLSPLRVEETAAQLRYFESVMPELGLPPCRPFSRCPCWPSPCR
jgi:adenine deaminase